MSDAFFVTSEVLPTTARVVSFDGREAVSRPYSFAVYLLVPREDDSALDMAAVVNARATLGIRSQTVADEQTVFHGVVSAIEAVDALVDDVLYRVVLVPRFWQLTLSLHSNVFVNQTIPTIIEGVLLDSGLAASDFSLLLTRAYPVMEHVCQYRESNFDFVSRWMEREGMYYYFEQGDERERLVITDDRSCQPRLGTRPVQVFTGDATGAAGRDGLYNFSCQHRAVPASVSLRDYDYMRPSLDVSGAAGVASNGAGEIAAFGENLVSPSDGRRLARVRAQELQTRQVVYQGRGRAFGLRAGHRFEIDGHSRAAFNAEYQAIEVVHRGNLFRDTPALAELVDVGADDIYRVTVAAVAAGVQFRAERLTPTPRIYGIEAAIVDGPADSEYAQLDEHGRYSVKIMFDESDRRNGQASTRVRMLQPHGGSVEGFHFPLRKNTEVVLVFLGGDPDRPMIAGVAPNAHTPSPVLADNHTLNILQTGGLNRIELQDSAGGQYIKMKTPTQNTMLHLGAPHNPQHNFELRTDGNGLIQTGTQLDVTVGAMKVEDVTGAVEETYLSTQLTTVTGRVTETYNAGQTTTVTGDRADTVTAAVVEEFGSLKSTVHGAVEEIYQAGQTTTVTGARKDTVTAAVTELYGSQKTTATGTLDITAGPTTMTLATLTTTIAGAQTETISGSLTQNITGGATVVSPAGYSVVAPASLLKLTSASAELAGFKFTLAGSKVDVTGLFLSANGAKIEANGIKVEVSGLQHRNTPVEISEVVATIRLCAFILQTAGIHIFS